jgi:hypothetical protein
LFEEGDFGDEQIENEARLERAVFGHELDFKEKV